jgi:hypothetical protein
LRDLGEGRGEVLFGGTAEDVEEEGKEDDLECVRRMGSTPRGIATQRLWFHTQK